MVMPGPGGEWQLEQLVAEQERSKARAVLHLRVYPPLCWLHTPIQLPRTPQPGGSLSSRVAHSTATNILWACLSNPRPALHQLESLACALFAQARPTCAPRCCSCANCLLLLVLQDPTLDASSGLSLVATARAVIKDIAAALLLPVPSPATLCARPIRRTPARPARRRGVVPRPSPPSLEEVHSKLAHPKPRKPTTKLEVPAQVGAPPSMPASDTAYRMMEDAERQAKRLKPVFGKVSPPRNPLSFAPSRLYVQLSYPFHCCRGVRPRHAAGLLLVPARWLPAASRPVTCSEGSRAITPHRVNCRPAPT